MTRLRLAVVAGLVTAASAVPFATPANAMICPEPAKPACTTLGIVCQELANNPKLPDCPGLG